MKKKFSYKLLSLALAASMLLFHLPTSIAFAEDSGWRRADGVNSSTIFVYSAEKAYDSPDNDFATFGGNSSNHKAEAHYAFPNNFSIPAGATITGIEVQLLAGRTGNNNRTFSVSLAEGATVVAQTTANLAELTTNFWGTITGGWSTYTLGGTWGGSWTAAKINSANFEVQVKSSNDKTYLKNIQMKVSYTVPDTEKPVITLTGSTPMNTKQGQAYTDQGAVWTDNIDGTGAAIVGGDVVNTAAIGTYYVTYNYTDAAGNAADQVTRTVNVRDGIAPVITLTGSNPVNIDQNQTYTEQGATWTDNVDGSGAALVGGDAVNTAVPGIYHVTYNYTDAADNAATPVTRTVNVRDAVAPVIALTGSDPFNIDQNQTYTEPGAIWTDAADGTGAAIVGGDTVNTAVPGTYTVTYNYTDKAGNKATEATRRVIVRDAIAPVITLTGSNSVNVDQNQPYTEQGAVWTDAIDGTGPAAVGGDTVNTAIAGTYAVTYNYTDAAGNAAVEVTRTVNVLDKEAPVIDPQSNITVEATSAAGAVVTFSPTASDNFDGSLSVLCSIPSGSTFPIGTTTVTCAATDTAGNAAIPVTFDVTVEDTIAPLITLTGSNSVNVDQNQPYTEQGAVWTDAIDGTGPAAVGGDTVNTAIAGTYAVTYNYTDAAGNAAVEVTRTVNVLDKEAPVIDPQSNITVEATSAAGAVVTFSPTAPDNFDASVTVLCSIPSGSTFPIGTTTVTCAATDTAGNAAIPVTFDVTVEDTTAPLITLTGSDPVNVDQNTAYTEQGATWADAVDGSGAAIVGGDTVNTAIAGTYTVTYNYTDAAGNAAVEVTRTVNVLDKEAPVIASQSNITVEATSAAGAVVTFAPTALDNYDAAVTVICSTPSGSTFATGKTTVTCTATDTAGNAAISVTFDVTVEDTTAPLITLTGSDPVNVDQNTAYTEPGATWTDIVDGTGAAIVGGDTINTAIPGTYTVTYNYTDAAGNAAVEATRTVNVLDKEAPVIAAQSNITVEATSAAGTVVTFAPSATDNHDAAVTVICSTPSGSTFAIGKTTVTCTAMDSAGNAAIPVTFDVTVQDTTVPVIALNGSDPLNINQDLTYTEPGATWTDIVDGTGAAIIGGDTVNTAIPGTYTVTYNYTDTAGNIATEVTRTVNVLDTKAPVIAAQSNITVEAASAAGTVVTFAPSATDNVDAAISVICSTPSGSTFPIGTTTVTCMATDTAGNAAIPVTFDVTVQDTTAPLITLTGSDPLNINQDLTYTEQGATFTDAVDGTGAVIIGGDAVNTAKPGKYIVTYNYTDKAGNKATEVTRTVNVLDTKAPVIAAQSNLILEATGATGAAVTFAPTASDNVDASVLVLCSISSGSTFSIGTTTVTCTATDAAGNTAIPVTFTVTVRDTTAPLLTLTGANTVNINQDQTYTEQGATFTDAVDGTGTAIVGGDVVNSARPGTYRVAYTYTDASGNAAVQVIRTVIVRTTPDPVVAAPTITAEPTQTPTPTNTTIVNPEVPAGGPPASSSALIPWLLAAGALLSLMLLFFLLKKKRQDETA